MTNKEIAKQFSDLASIMELHLENPFKIRSYKNTYITLRKLDTPLADMSVEEIAAMKGVGKNTVNKIQELLETGKLETYQKYVNQTPLGVVNMLQIKGFGPSKIRAIWKDLGVETVGELLYACNENRLIDLKGFGKKTQADLIKKIHFYFNSQGKYLFARIEPKVAEILAKLQAILPDVSLEITGEMRRKCPVISKIEFLVAQKDITAIFNEEFDLQQQENDHYKLIYQEEIPFYIHTCTPEEWGSKQFKYSSPLPFIKSFLDKATEKDFTGITTEKAVFDKANLPYIAPIYRDLFDTFEQTSFNAVSDVDVKGVVHAHSTYSDGIHSLKDMARASKKLGYQYLGITDHSKSAFYANGLKPDRVLEQWQEIDELNASLKDFRIYKGIESDILNDGSLDYEEDILKGFDFIIASVHTNLKMNKEKATQRLITAIENPYTTILGHPTGRILLSREGYPIDHKKVIDACAANGVAIEMNANPLRLDLDYNWIPYAMEKGVKISINPDAHSKEGITDIQYGIIAANKGGLTPEFVFDLAAHLENV